MGLFGKKMHALDILIFGGLDTSQGGPLVKTIASCEKLGFLKEGAFDTMDEASDWMEDVISGFGPNIKTGLKAKSGKSFHFVAWVPGV